MHYVILRDDDTCALTPVECLERLYRPFLDRGLPVNLATIPNVHTGATRTDGQREEFLQFNHGTTTPNVPIGQNRPLVEYLLGERDYHVLHHGYDHSLFEFDCSARKAAHLLSAGAERLAAAGFPTPAAFVAPYDRFSAASLRAAAQRYAVISSGWFEWRRLPPAWWPKYAAKKVLHQPHWRIRDTILLSHPGCILSRHHPLDDMLERVRAAVKSQPLTVLVTHWWEYFRATKPDLDFIAVLHRTAEFLAHDPDIKVISFADLATGRVVLPGRAAADYPGGEIAAGSSGLPPAGQPAYLSGARRTRAPRSASPRKWTPTPPVAS